ncbi:MAG: hypothetical protein JWL73_1021 [Actinomycetia bacterium]|nr:hypothetical protein [Actinomycetes bacterium]
MSAAPETSRGTIMWWGFTRRCPRCGSGHLFHHYLAMVPDCPRCRLHFEREPGYFAGALAINIMATGGLFAVSFVVALALTIPEIPVVPLLLILVPIALFGPILFYPFSKTIWIAVDRGYLQRLDPSERADEHFGRKPGGRGPGG